LHDAYGSISLLYHLPELSLTTIYPNVYMKHLNLASSATLMTALILTVSCATPYQTQGFRGGFNETQLAENIFEVHFKGNGYTGAQTAADYCMYRCSEIAIEHGYKYFAVIDSDASTKNSTYVAPASSTTTFSGNTARTTYSGGGVYNIAKPRSKNMIVLMKEKPSDNSIVYEASFVKESIGGKYQIGVEVINKEAAANKAKHDASRGVKN